MMDMPGADPELLRQDLGNLRRINRYFGGHRALQRGFRTLLSRLDSRRTMTILDLATGSGDQPVALMKFLCRAGYMPLVTAVDRNPRMLEEARKVADGIDGIVFEQHDITNLPYGDDSYDIVVCSLAIHHLPREKAVVLLREMKRIGRIGFVVNDLLRSATGVATAWLYSRLTTRNPMTRYDSVLSVKRAFTKDELLGMLREAGIQDAAVFSAPFFRLIAVGME